MMQLIREKTQGIVTWGIIALIVIAFCSWGVSNYFSNGSGPVVAVVNGTKITTYQVDELYNRWLRYSAAQKGFDINLVDPKLIKQQIAKSLAQQQALVSGLQKNGLAISDDILLATLTQDSNMQENGKFSIERYKNYLAQLNLDEATFEQLRKEELLIQQAQQAVLASSISMPDEVAQVIKIRNQKRSFGYTVVNALQYKPAASAITDAQVSEYYAKNGASFVIPERVKLEYIELSIDNITKNIAATEENLRAYYNSNLAIFTEPELIHVRHVMADSKEKIDAIYQQLKQGKSFVETAKQNSIDTQTANIGGDLGWVSKNDGYPEEVYALATNNAFTAPVQTSFGWHVFQLIERKQAKPKPYESVKAAVTARFKREEAERLFTAAGEELANLAAENTDSLLPASEKLRLPILTTDFFAQQGGTGIASSKPVIKAAFSPELLKEHKNSELIRLSDDSYVVIRVQTVQPQQQQSLEDVRAQIVAFLQSLEAVTKTKQAGEKLLQQVQAGQKPAGWKIEKDVTRENRTVPANVLQQVFTAAKPIEDKPSVVGLQLPDGDYVIVAVDAVTEGKLNISDESSLSEMLAEQIAVLKGQVEFATLQAQLIAKAKIKYSE